MKRLLFCLCAATVAVGCAPSLRLTRPTPPEANLGNIHTLSVTVSTDVGKSVENAVVKGLAFGELPVPVPVEGTVKERLEARLQSLGYTVCPAAPCGEGAMTVVLTESTVGTEFTSSGLRAHSRITARVKVKQLDGTEPYDFSFWDRRSGRVEEAPMLVQGCAESIANRFANTLLPGRQTSTLPLEDGGPLSMGVNMLLASNWTGAISYFAQLTRDQPDLDGAWYDLGVAWEAQGDWGQALSAYEQAASRKRSRTYLDAVASARSMVPVNAAPTPQPIPVQ